MVEDAPATVRPIWLAVALALAAAIVGVAAVRQSPPAPLPLDAPPAMFSAARAGAVLRELAGDQRPHPVGSAADAAVRARLVARLQALGVPTAVHTVFACSGAEPVCGTVTNVVARLPGGSGPRAVMLAAHYDSVGAGPGIADDLASVAALVEIARALRAGPPPTNPVVLLIDEGEEAGLLGAEGFVASDPLASQIGAAINLEARGTGGPSLMFETSDENGWLIDAYGRSVRRLAALSLTYEAYKRLPNDTDLTVFKRAGMPGMNFAFIDEVSHYHTPLDDLAGLDPASLQHQGESALAVARALGGADLAHPRPGRSVYQDLLGLVLLRWPAGLTAPLAAGAGAVVLLWVWLAVRRGEVTPGEVLWGLGGFFAVVLAAIAAGLALTRSIEALARTAEVWRAHPLPTLLSLWCGVLAAGAAAASLAARRAGFRGLFAGSWLGWCGLAAVAAAAAPGASTMFLIPLLAAAVALAVLAAVPRGMRHVPLAAAGLVPLAAAAWTPLSFLLAATFGLARGVAISVPLAMVTTALAPLLALPQAWRRRRALALVAVAGVAVAAAVAASLLPKYSAARPERLSITYGEDGDTGAARWLAGGPGAPLPAGVRAAAGFAANAVHPLPFSPQREYAAPAPPLGLPAPELVIVGSQAVAGGRVVSALLRSARGAPNLALFLPAEAPLVSVSAEGRPVRLGRSQPGPGRFRRLAFVAVPAAGVALTLVLRGAEPVGVFVADQSPGLPATGQALLSARPPSAVPSDGGDTTVVWRPAIL
jgi:Peptidase family M28